MCRYQNFLHWERSDGKEAIPAWRSQQRLSKIEVALDRSLHLAALGMLNVPLKIENNKKEVSVYVKEWGRIL